MSKLNGWTVPRTIRFIIIFPLGVLWEMCGWFAEWWHFGPSQWLLHLMRVRTNYLSSFVQWKKPRKYSTWMGI